MLLEVNINFQHSIPTYPLSSNPSVVISGSAPKDVHINQKNYQALSAIIGSGGSINRNYHLINDSHTGSMHVIVTQRISETVPDQLSEIKRFLIPQIKDIATVLGVQRQSVYAWLAGENVTKENSLRVREIHTFAAVAKDKFFGTSKKALVSHLNKSDLVNLLSKTEISKAEIERELDRVSKAAIAQTHKINARPKLDLKHSAMRTGAVRDLEKAQDTLDILIGRGYLEETKG
ncbi:hypothetical protein [Deinococcus radiophilus]|uniref:XRE family transcriptional regulator n=1 Tax=Deinococcus radiophilus TaxID=32062 RepID=A0A431W0Q1_9DEIO|nr:hypothetical protein [Deinococcus radiophilus]RTR29084.1 hypothetical protein EJ104_04365 [Deinococcus radiophilus]UFA49671.1 hypothetical protein LMT64_07130 [Deinococcus radiophilus]